MNSDYVLFMNVKYEKLQLAERTFLIPTKDTHSYIRSTK